MRKITLAATLAISLSAQAQSSPPSPEPTGNPPLTNTNLSNPEPTAPAKSTGATKSSTLGGGDSLNSSDSTTSIPRSRNERPRRDRKTRQNSETSAAPSSSGGSVNTASPISPSSTNSQLGSDANSTKNLLDHLDYPELNVVPRASERLQTEAQREASFGWLSFWPFNLSAISTLYAGYASAGNYKDAGVRAHDTLDLYSRSAMAVGASWLALTTYYSFTKPYVRDWDRIRKIKGNDRRSDLTRERYAEEALEEPARLIKIFTWASVVTNFAINVMLIDAATPDKNINPVIGAFGALLPLIFNNRYIENFEKQQEYKRKIYAPVAGVGFQQNIYTAKLEPQLTFNWSF